MTNKEMSKSDHDEHNLTYYSSLQFLSEERIRRLLSFSKWSPQEELFPRSEMRQASVLLPIFLKNGDWNLLFTRRTESVNDHKGQVSFPGGASEAGDVSPEGTALREAWEEIGLDPNDVKLLGRLPDQQTISKFIVTPIVGSIPADYEFSISNDEVERVFSIPIKWLAAPDHFEERLFKLPDGIERKVTFYNSFEGEILWGISAKITLTLLRQLNLLK